MKVSELTLDQLDQIVARLNGWTRRYSKTFECDVWRDEDGELMCMPASGYRPTRQWSEGGQLIDKHRINFATIGTGPRDEHGNEPIVAITANGRNAMTGPTHLIAAMRAIVRDTYGEEIPDENL
jgi:hypothetical protein